MTAGLASYGGWIVFNLCLLVLLPFLVAIGLAGGERGRSTLRRFAVSAVRFFFLRFLPSIGIYRFVELPDPTMLESLGPCVIVANHRSWIDALFVLALVPGVRMPVNARYLRVPLVGRALLWAGCTPLDGSSAESLTRGVAACREAVARGEPLCVFPEGTRAPFGPLLPFADLGFRIAKDAGVPIRPLLLHSDFPYLGRDRGSSLTPRTAEWRIILEAPVIVGPAERASDVARRVRRDMGKALARLDAETGARREEAR